MLENDTDHIQIGRSFSKNVTTISYVVKLGALARSTNSLDELKSVTNQIQNGSH